MPLRSSRDAKHQDFGDGQGLQLADPWARLAVAEHLCGKTQSFYSIVCFKATDSHLTDLYVSNLTSHLSVIPVPIHLPTCTREATPRAPQWLVPYSFAIGWVGKFDNTHFSMPMLSPNAAVWRQTKHNSKPKSPANGAPSTTAAPGPKSTKNDNRRSARRCSRNAS